MLSVAFLKKSMALIWSQYTHCCCWRLMALFTRGLFVIILAAQHRALFCWMISSVHSHWGGRYYFSWWMLKIVIASLLDRRALPVRWAWLFWCICFRHWIQQLCKEQGQQTSHWSWRIWLKHSALFIQASRAIQSAETRGGLPKQFCGVICGWDSDCQSLWAFQLV